MPSKILVVDDNKAHLDFIEIALELAGYEAVTASTVDAALLAIENTEIQAAIVDFNLSDRLNGVQLCRKIGENPRTKTIPVIIISGGDLKTKDEDLIRSAFKSGALDFIHKPFKADVLHAVLEEHLGKDGVSAVPKEMEDSRKRATAALGSMDSNSAALDKCAEILNEVYELINTDCALAMDKLFVGLRALRQCSNRETWEGIVKVCLDHPLKEIVHQDPFTYRSFSKPRGYAGDAETLDFVYGATDGTATPKGLSGIGRGVFEYTTNAPAPQGARARRKLIVTMLDRLGEEVKQASVLNIAAGHLTEGGLSKAIKGRKFGRYVALDWDKESMEAVRSYYGQYGVETVSESVRRLLTGKANLGQFDFIYSLGLYDYLEQKAATRLTEVLFGMLKPGGRLVLANFLPGIHDVGYMETYMAWDLVYRTPQQMLDLASDVPMERLRDIRLTVEENHNIVFLQLTRSRFRSEWMDFGS